MRSRRHTLKFGTASGEDYARQLHAIGAILALTNPTGDVVVVRNLLQKPAKMQHEDLRTLDLNYFIDGNRESVASLASALGLGFAPKEFVALLPHEIEQQLLEKELAFRNCPE